MYGQNPQVFIKTDRFFWGFAMVGAIVNDLGSTYT
jgi:hypothetical protein